MKLSLYLNVFALLLFLFSSETAFSESQSSLIKGKAPFELSVVDDGDGVVIFLNSSVQCGFQYLATGYRAIFDCTQIKIPQNQTIILEENPFVTQLRLGSYPDKIRIVADLKIAEVPQLESAKEKQGYNYKLSFKGEQLRQTSITSIPDGQIKALEVPPAPTAAPTEIPPPNPTEPPPAIEESAQTPSSVLPFVKPDTVEEMINEPESPAPTPTPVASIQLAPEIQNLERPLSIETLDIRFTEGERLIKDVVVTNQGGYQLNVNIDSYPVTLSSNENDLAIVKDTLTLSPRKFTLGPDQKRAIRLLLIISSERKDSEQELQFKVRFSNDLGEELAPQISVAYIPKGSLPNLVSIPFDGKLKLKNNGKSSVRLRSGKCCRGTDCQPVAVTKLNAGESKLLEVPEDCRLEFINEDLNGFNRFFVDREIETDAEL
jgi:hypothetical protein